MNTIKLVTRLTLICVAAALCLGVTYSVTNPIITRLAEEAAAEAFRTLFPDALTFTDVDFHAEGDFEAITGVVASAGASDFSGWCVSITTTGYKGIIPLVVGIKPDGSLAGIRVGANDETVGLGSRISEPAYYGQFAGVKPPLILKKDIQAVSGATISSRAVVDAVNTVRAFYERELSQPAR